MPHCQTLLDDLRLRGYRITPQREIIIEAIAHASTHLSADEIFVTVQERTKAINLATIYRTLDMLVEEGFVCRNDLGSGRIVYATHQHGPHLHLVCRQCGQVIEVDSQVIDPIETQLLEQNGFQADLNHLSIFGLCAQCQKGA